MKTLFKNKTVFTSFLIQFLFPLLFSSLGWGDMLHPSDNAAVSDDVLKRRWPNGVIPYTVVLESGTTYTKTDFDNDRNWETLTQGAVRFVDMDSIDREEDEPYIEVHIDNNIWSRSNGLRGICEADGRKTIPGRIIWVEPDGSWNVNHELGHVIGLWHQQRHPNSEQCVTVHNETPSQLHPSKFIGHYSTDSIMHYNWRVGSPTFASWVTDPSDPTVCLKRTNADPDPSDFDVHHVWKMYGVNGEYLNHTDWCSGDGQRVFMGDFNGDGLDDLLCHAKEGGTSAGHRFIDYAQLNSANVFGNGDWEKTSNIFCRSADRNLYVGDFNGDDRDDLLCHDSNDGRRFVDYANEHGHLNGTNDRFDSFCAGPGKTIYVGDFDGDGKDDMLCHTKNSGALSIDYAVNGFTGSDWRSNDVWCREDTQSIIIGDFNSDNRDDMICHDISDGRRWIDYAHSSGDFKGSEWASWRDKRARPFCWGSNRKV